MPMGSKRRCEWFFLIWTMIIASVTDGFEMNLSIAANCLGFGFSIATRGYILVKN